MPHTEAKLDAAATAIVQLSVAVRDLSPDDTKVIAQRALRALSGDAVAALIVAAALIRVDQPMDVWWQKPLTEQPAWTAPARPDLPGCPEPEGGWRPVTPQQGRENLQALCAARGVAYDPSVHIPAPRLAVPA